MKKDKVSHRAQARTFSQFPFFDTSYSFFEVALPF